MKSSTNISNLEAAMPNEIEIDNKVKCADGSEGFVVAMRRVGIGYVAKVVRTDGFENWYPVKDLEKLPYKERYVNRY